MNLARRETELEGWHYEQRRLQLVAQVHGRFVDLLAAQEQLRLGAEMVQLAEQALAAVAERVRVGKSVALEETKAEVVVERARLELAAIERTREVARHRLAACWGREQPRFTSAAGDLRRLPATASFAELRARLPQNPVLARGTALLGKGAAMRDLAIAGAVPDLTLRAGFKRINGLSEGAFTVGFALPVPLFDRNQGEILRARYFTEQARVELQASEVQLTEELAEAHRDLEMALDRALVLERKIVPAAQRSYAGVLEGFEAGKFAFLDVLDAQRTLVAAKADYITTLQSAHRAHTRVEVITASSLEQPVGEDQGADHDAE